MRTFRARRRGHAAAHARRARARPGRRRRLRRSGCAITSPTSGAGDGRSGDGDPRPPAATPSRARSARTAGASRPSSCARPGASGLPVALACAVAREGDRLSQRLRPRRGAQPDQEPARRPAGGHPGQLPPVPGSPPPGARQPGRRPDAADEPVLQDRADQLGGCWQPGPNIRVGARVPGRQHPPPGAARRRGGLQRLGPGRAALRRRRAGPRAAVGRSACAARARRAPQPDRPSPTPTPAPRPGRPAADLPPGVAARCAGATSRPSSSCSTSASPRWSIDKRIDVDGEYGPMTRRAARQAVYALGISGTELAHGVTPELRSKLRRPSRRTPDEVAHADPPPGLARAGCAASTRAGARRRRSPTRASTSGSSRARRRPIAGRSSIAGTARPAPCRGARGAATSPTPA